MAFYNSAKSEFNDRPHRNLSETVGFFNIRQNRNGSQMAITTKSFGNQQRAKERSELIAKNYFEKQNLIALNKAKNQKMVEKAAKEEQAIRKDRLEKLHEKQK